MGADGCRCHESTSAIQKRLKRACVEKLIEAREPASGEARAISGTDREGLKFDERVGHGNPNNRASADALGQVFD
jgi:hypothetical protein